MKVRMSALPGSGYFTSLTASFEKVSADDNWRDRDLQKHMTNAQWFILTADAVVPAGMSFLESVSKIVKITVKTENENENVRLTAVDSLTSLAKTGMYIHYVE